ncbi:hypothetical protein DH2020_027750 [Rehmannia glutinosa]|uniref:Reverse transcriptase zinc-binding domain-containing protein n=1 Tax=Rehmannia glutinosa TaxID=99300 RepID=A0ABR0VW19_REHGL
MSGRAECRVNKLIDLESHTWDEDRVVDWVGQEKARKILRIPLRNFCGEDRLAWNFSSNGIYSVKSGYQIALQMNNVGRDSPSHSGEPLKIWKWIWSLNIPPKIQVFLWKVANGILPVKTALSRRRIGLNPMCIRCGLEDETMEHALRDCPWSNFYWRASPLRLDHLANISNASIIDMVMEMAQAGNTEVEETFSMLLWALWYARNALIFNGKELSHVDCFLMATTSLHNYQDGRRKQLAKSHAQMPKPAGQWRKPREGVLKINTDASMIQLEGTGIGAVVRDHHGDIRSVLMKKFSQEFEVDVAEAVACREALILASTSSFPRIVVETDSQVLANGLNR